MKNLLKIFLGITFSIALFSCAEEYKDTKEAGEKYLVKVANQGTEMLSYTKDNQLIYVNAPIQVLSDGLMYAVYYTNEYGEYPRTDIITYVSLNYKGYFIDQKTYFVNPEGTSTVYYSGLPAGLQEAIRKMKIGSKWKVWVPQSLGYGKDGSSSPFVDPYSTLIYEIELLNAY